MKCLIGFVLFWIAAGMFISLFIESQFVIISLIITFMILGFNLFCK